METAQMDQVIETFAKVDSDAPEKAARFLKSLAHRDRLRVLCALVTGELPVSEIERQTGARQSAVSQHLARLKAEGVVSARRDGRQILYSISDPIVFGVIELLYEKFCAEK